MAWTGEQAGRGGARLLRAACDSPGGGLKGAGVSATPRRDRDLVQGQMQPRASQWARGGRTLPSQGPCLVLSQARGKPLKSPCA